MRRYAVLVLVAIIATWWAYSLASRESPGAGSNAGARSPRTTSRGSATGEPGLAIPGSDAMSARVVQVHVHSLEGTAIAGAFIQLGSGLRGSAFVGEAATCTDDTGMATVRVDRINTWVTATAEGFAPGSARVTRGMESVRIDLAPGPVTEVFVRREDVRVDLRALTNEQAWSE